MNKMESNFIEIENLIIGAGPSGVQLGYFLKKNDLEYLILERNESACSFFKKYPIGRELISFNKRFTGSEDPEYNLRFDWHSFLNDEGILFRDFSREFYPKADDYVRYVQFFSEQLNISFNSNVVSVKKIDSKYLIETDSKKYICTKLFIGTGQVPKNDPDLLNYSDFSENIEEKLKSLENKKICIIGGGNSAFEMAQILNNVASSIILLARTIKFSNFTHYSGHLRSKLMGFIDTFSLKIHNGIAKNRPFMNDFIRAKKEGLKLSEVSRVPLSFESDEIVSCIGFQSFFDFIDFEIETNEKNYPVLNYKYESINNENLFFIGSMMHSLDFEKSSGGFIHGFRYLIRYMFNEVFLNHHNQVIINTIDDVSSYLINRLRRSSSLYLMFDYMCDIVYKDGDSFKIIEDVTYDYCNTVDFENYVIISITFGKPLQSLEELLNPAFNSEKKAKIPKFLHIKFANSNKGTKIVFRSAEDFIGKFDLDCYEKSIREYLTYFF